LPEELPPEFSELLPESPDLLLPMTVRIEKHSLEIEERLRKAEEQNQNEKRVEHKEKESQEVR
jgi:hypothetical protein